MNPVWYFLNGVPVIPVIQTGVNLAGDGSASAPSYSFASEPELGMFRGGASQIDFADSGATLVRINNSFGALDLRSDWALRWGSSGVSTPDVSLSRGAANRLDLATGDSFYVVSGGLGVGVVNTTASTISADGSISTVNGNITATNGTLSVAATAVTGSQLLGALSAGGATSVRTLVKKVTGIADAVATDVLTVTVPNANHAAAIKVTFLSSNGSTDAFESSRVAEGAVILARTTGVATVAAVATLELAQIATVGSGATHTLAYGASAMTGAVGAQQTFTIQVTINDSGNVGSNQVVVLAELINAEATGITIA